ncbi:hypothetical protein ABK040_003218 [Willaertia magna]
MNYNNPHAYQFVDETIKSNEELTNYMNTPPPMLTPPNIKLRKSLQNKDLLKNYFEWSNVNNQQHQHQQTKIVNKPKSGFVAKENEDSVFQFDISNNNGAVITRHVINSHDRKVVSSSNNNEASIIDVKKDGNTPANLNLQHRVIIGDQLGLHLDLDDFLASLEEMSGGNNNK